MVKEPEDKSSGHGRNHRVTRDSSGEVAIAKEAESVHRAEVATTATAGFVSIIGAVVAGASLIDPITAVAAGSVATIALVAAAVDRDRRLLRRREHPAWSVADEVWDQIISTRDAV